MTRSCWTEFPNVDAVLALAAARKDGVAVGLALLADPARRAFTHFLTVATGVGADALEPVFLDALAAVGRKAGRGQLAPADPWPMVKAVLAVRAGKAAKREARRMRGGDVARCAGAVEGETAEGLWAGEWAAVNRVLDTHLDPFGLAVFRAMAEYTRRHGTDHGGLTAVASGVRVGTGGELWWCDDEPDLETVPDPRVYRAVRAAFLRTKAAVVRVLEARGVEVPPSFS